MQDLPANYFLPDSKSLSHGKKVIKEGKVAAIVLAGGHGSRLGFDAPKGCFPITKDGKSLYQLVAEKVKHASALYGRDLLLGVMTSDTTHEKTVEHFEKETFFGLKQVFFFQQANLPLQDEEGTVLQTFAPNGSGALFWDFQKAGHLASWQAQGISHIVVFTIDNALADPFEPHLIGLHDQHQNDVTVVGIKRETAEEQVGVLVERDHTLRVIEYSEMPDVERLALDETGNLKYPTANISYFAFSIAFINKMLKLPLTELPLHKARKKVPINGEEKYLYKSEYFIFDVLPYCDKAEVLLLPREKYFAPLKNKTGPQSVATVQAALDALKI